jgi:hypothetical protein
MKAYFSFKSEPIWMLILQLAPAVLSLLVIAVLLMLR